MRPYLIGGILVFGLGIFLLLRGGTFTTRRDVLKVGDVKVTADEQQSIPPWVGGAALAVGLALIVAGAKQKS